MITMRVFVQIGTNNGDDLFRRRVLVERPDRVVLIEANPALIPDIARNYDGIPGVCIINKAIYYENDKVVNLYIAAKNKILGSRADNGIVYNDGHYSLLPMNDWGDKSDMVSFETQSITFSTMCTTLGITDIEYLQIDTEGFDSEIIKMIDLTAINISIIRYENWGFPTECFTKYHPTIADRLGKAGMNEVASKLTSHGYLLWNIKDADGNDVIAVKAEPDQEAAVARVQRYAVALG